MVVQEKESNTKQGKVVLIAKGLEGEKRCGMGKRRSEIEEVGIKGKKRPRKREREERVKLPSLK